jgi:hypothetical protein
MVEEREREGMRDFLVKAYADGVIEEAELEAKLTAMEAATEAAALDRIAVEVQARYPVPVAPAYVPAPPQGGEVQAIRGRGMSKKYRGRWFSSERISVELAHSSVELDFAELAAFPGARIDISVTLTSSSLKILLPRGAEAVDEVDNEYSSIKIRRKGENELGIFLRIRGTARMSSVTVKAR